MTEPLGIVVFLISIIAVSLLILFVICFVLAYFFINQERRNADYERQRAERYWKKVKELKEITNDK